MLYQYIFYVYIGILSLIIIVWTGFTAFTSIKIRKKPEFKKYDPKVIVIMPCKGEDLELEKGLKSILEQDYPKDRYDLITVVESEKDPALKIIKKIGIRYILSENICAKCSGKVRSLTTAFTKFRSYDVFVTVDSDAYCKRDWLRSLVEPLSDKRIGVTTTFPYFKPVGKANFWTKVKLVWGFIGNGLMENDITRFAWGGSMAFRKEFLDSKSLKIFSEALSDDITISSIAREKKLDIFYVNKRIIYIPSKTDFDEFKEWSIRQTALTFIADKRVFNYGVALCLINMVVFLSGIILAFEFSYIFLIFLLPFFYGIIRLMIRVENKDRSPMLIFIYLLLNYIYLINLLAAKNKKTITWRGITYELEQ